MPTTAPMTADAAKVSLNRATPSFCSLLNLNTVIPQIYFGVLKKYKAPHSYKSGGGLAGMPSGLNRWFRCSERLQHLLREQRLAWAIHKPVSSRTVRQRW